MDCPLPQKNFRNLEFEIHSTVSHYWWQYWQRGAPQVDRTHVWWDRVENGALSAGQSSGGGTDVRCGFTGGHGLVLKSHNSLSQIDGALNIDIVTMALVIVQLLTNGSKFSKKLFWHSPLSRKHHEE